MSAYKSHPPYKILPQQLKAAKKLGVIIKPSKDKMKKIDVFKIFKFADGAEDEVKISEIGGYYMDGVPYGDYWTYKKKPVDRYGKEVDADERRRRYLARHDHEKKEKIFTFHFGEGGKKNYKIPSPSAFADKILW